jgi:hypothetical protein
MKEAFSYTSQVRGTQWDPTQGRTPFNVITGMGYLEDMLKGNIRKDEERAKAPKIFPFPLDRIVDQLAKCYEELMKTKSTISTTIRTALLSPEEKNLLRANVRYIDKCIDYIKKMSADVEKIHL